MYDLEVISEKIVEMIEEFLDHFGHDYVNQESRISMACPIHGGDNPEGLGIDLRGMGNWTCFTHGCNEEYTSSIISLSQALLEIDLDREVSFSEALQWCVNFTGENGTIDQNEWKANKEKSKIINIYRYVVGSKIEHEFYLRKEYATKDLKVPSKYFISRGYSSDILKKYSIGLCTNSKDVMYNRIVVPCYSDDGQYVIGSVGRSTYDICNKCKKYHTTNVRCPKSKIELKKCSKWKNSGGFKAESYLYNYWRAKKTILSDRTAILVEGPSDVWKLEEADINCSVALLGTKFTRDQLLLLEQSGALNLVILTDNDDAGKKARENIRKICKRQFNIYTPELLSNDPGGMEIDDLKKLLYDLLNRISYNTTRRYNDSKDISIRGS